MDGGKLRLVNQYFPPPVLNMSNKLSSGRKYLATLHIYRSQYLCAVSSLWPMWGDGGGHPWCWVTWLLVAGRGGVTLHWYSLYSSWRTPSEVQGRKAEPCTDLSSAVSNWGQPKHWGAPASWSWTMIEQVRCEVFSGHPSQCFYHAKNLQITCLLQ